ncbi:MAG: HAMP domain-containing histidine kinase [Dehalococcoidia bacterium]|nr:HAMP domain-containing histidine kinase [Dehalococcoidia bacterium]
MYRRARLRLTIWYAAAFLVVLIVLGVGTYLGLVWAIDREVDASIEAVSDDWVAAAPPLGSLQPLDLEAHRDGAPSDVFLVVFRSDGALVANPRGLEAEELLESGVVEVALGGQDVWETLSRDGSRLRVRAAPLVQGGRVVGAVVAGRNLAGRDESVRTLVIVLGFVSGGGLLLALAAGYVLAGRALAPLRLAIERQRTFIGDASHELRSPVTLIRALAELLQRDDLTPDQRATTDDLVAVSDEASALIDDLLTLARLSEDGDAPAAPAATDLARAAGLACDRMGIRLGDHDSEVERHLEPAPALLSESEAMRVVRVLIENVVAHTPPGTRLVVATSVDRHAARLLVEDDGPGVPAAELERIFERFTQLDAARTPGAGGGAGLGLAIVRAIAQRRGGHAAASSSSLGGLRVEVTFPRATVDALADAAP